MRATYTAQTDAQLQQWQAEGVPLKEQARRLNVKRSTLDTWRRRLGLTRGYPPITPAMDARIKEWIADGWPLKEIAATSGLALDQIRLEYPGAGVSTRVQGQLGAAVRTAVRMNPTVMRGLR